MLITHLFYSVVIVSVRRRLLLLYESEVPCINAMMKSESGSKKKKEVNFPLDFFYSLPSFFKMSAYEHSCDRRALLNMMTIREQKKTLTKRAKLYTSKKKERK
jgi:hypothetical protein